MKRIGKAMAFVFALVLCLGMLPGAATAAGRDAARTEKAVRADQPQTPIPQPVSDPTFVFTSSAPFTLATAYHARNWDGTLEYSTDASHWTTWNGVATLSSGTYSGRQRLYLRGTGNTKITGGGYGCWVLTGSRIGCSGNIENLLDHATVAAGEHPLMAHYCYCALFKDCTSLTTAPELPATTLANYCYANMFSGCTALTSAPELPATTLTDGCYQEMFEDCTSLTTAPALPATTLANDCYQQMFFRCTSLTTAPALLPATTLAEECYEAMFSGCRSLTNAPELPATTLAYGCYDCMFANCTSLTTAPKLPATTLAYHCYALMFFGCASLTTVPELPATTLADYCYKEMFAGCTALTTPQTLPATDLPDCCYLWMFKGCTGIRVSAVPTNEYTVPYRIPSVGQSQNVVPGALSSMFSGTGGPFTGTPQVDRTYYLPGPGNDTDGGMLTFSSDAPFTLETANHARNWDGTLEYSTNAQTWTMWDGAATLSSAAHNGQQRLYLRGTGNTKITGGDYGCWVLTGGGIACSGNIENLLDYATVSAGDHPLMASSYCYYALFKDCASLTTAPELPAEELTYACYGYMFEGCTSLTMAPALPATTLASECYRDLFSGCTSLTTAPVLPATTLVGFCYYYMFSRCTSLKTAPELPATTLAEYCYTGMFNRCTSLTTAPMIFAEELADSCCESMFKDCTSLTSTPELLATTLAPCCYYYMFDGCTSLTTAPALPATTLAPFCYLFMFNGCTSLTTPSELPATDLPASCYAYMFKGCAGIRMSAVPTHEYNVPYRIPSVGQSQDVFPGALDDMFSGTGGPFAGTPQVDRTYYLPGPGNDMDGGMLTFSDDAPFTLATANHAKNWDGTLEYSTDASHWTTWDGAATLSSAAHNGRQKLYLRGTGNTKLAGEENYRWVLAGSGGGLVMQEEEPPQRLQFNGPNITCSGNIEDLLDYRTVAAGDHPQMAKKCFAWLFSGCRDLVKAPDLPAVVLNSRCYQAMFADCTSLTEAPALPATTLAGDCYMNMFSGCTSLVRVPALPSTTLQPYCYWEMFGGCTSLRTAPELPATIMKPCCYGGMFSGCTSLTNAPALPATTLASRCYICMFSDCTSLRTAPELPAMTLADGCYTGMFQHCTLLAVPPVLPAMTLASDCYCMMFCGCSSLTQIPLLPASELEDRCYYGMFIDCFGIKLSTVQTDEYNTPYRIPSAGTMQNNVPGAMYGMFNGTGGTFTGTPTVNTTYYLHYSNSIVG